MMLDFAHRPLVMLVVDVGTRRPLSATVSLAIADDDVATLERLARRAGYPQEIWVDRAREYHFRPIQSWSPLHRITLIYGPSPQTKSVAERLLRHLGGFLRDKHYPTLMELGHDIERWRQFRAATTSTIRNVNW
ncbi:transposase family protein [Bradyrhizobium sp. NAS80.1]|uniref:transposase family protein n=1 Tax=Bradyrhizobium sp. NAS80.1 TaxID=1680159 RepID=UPI00143D95FC|nr:transposase family protein [Bradyrhizobium sp. NAS80.1]